MPADLMKNDGTQLPEAEDDHASDSEEGVNPGADAASTALDSADQAAIPVRNRPRRKATEKPTGQDALRQSFSKRKKGIAAKAYQLSRLTNAKVALFVVNEKGSSWAYSTPDFGAAVSPAYLSLMRKLAGIPNSPKLGTEVIPHPANNHTTDDREEWRTQIHPALVDQQQAPSMYKIQPGPGVVTMLHPHGFHTTGQAVGHPTGHVSIMHAQQSALNEEPIVAVAPAQMYAAAPVSSGAKEAKVDNKGLKRASESVADKDDEAKKGKHADAEQEKPRLALTRQAAILPVEAPPPEGIFGKHHPFMPNHEKTS